MRLQRAGCVGQRQRAPEGTCQQRARPAAIRARERLVDARAGQQVRGRRAATSLLLHEIEIVVQEIRGCAADGLAPAASKAVVTKRRRRPAAHSDQLIPGIPRVAGEPVAPEIPIWINGSTYVRFRH